MNGFDASSFGAPSQPAAVTSFDAVGVSMPYDYHANGALSWADLSSQTGAVSVVTKVGGKPSIRLNDNPLPYVQSARMEVRYVHLEPARPDKDGNPAKARREVTCAPIPEDSAIPGAGASKKWFDMLRRLDSEIAATGGSQVNALVGASDLVTFWSYANKKINNGQAGHNTTVIPVGATYEVRMAGAGENSPTMNRVSLFCEDRSGEDPKPLWPADIQPGDIITVVCSLFAYNHQASGIRADLKGIVRWSKGGGTGQTSFPTSDGTE